MFAANIGDARLFGCRFLARHARGVNSVAGQADILSQPLVCLWYQHPSDGVVHGLLFSFKYIHFGSRREDGGEEHEKQPNRELRFQIYPFMNNNQAE